MKTYAVIANRCNGDVVSMAPCAAHKASTPSGGCGMPAAHNIAIYKNGLLIDEADLMRATEPDNLDPDAGFRGDKDSANRVRQFSTPVESTPRAS